MQKIIEWALRSYDHPLTSVSLFKYLGRVLMELENDWPALVGNLGNVQANRSRLSGILVWEGANTRVSGMLFKVVV